MDTSNTRNASDPAMILIDRWRAALLAVKQAEHAALADDEVGFNAMCRHEEVALYEALVTAPTTVDGLHDFAAFGREAFTDIEVRLGMDVREHQPGAALGNKRSTLGLYRDTLERARAAMEIPEGDAANTMLGSLVDCLATYSAPAVPLRSRILAYRKALRAFNQVDPFDDTHDHLEAAWLAFYARPILPPALTADDAAAALRLAIEEGAMNDTFVTELVRVALTYIARLAAKEAA
ncbi:hypothetical protein [Ancylobacter sp. TS-1]|uniref:hypothetical protein n=1 Tax=Ancylobacter sp. TS-1 TaxID=1850374 RepID=UPI001265B1B1|nr:hypothetical protein [Ancylobacter sp. TS-1]QFR34716.1 hypothetical protein GBB76_17295 [Ancylobacter sp. TS-1]